MTVAIDDLAARLEFARQLAADAGRLAIEMLARHTDDRNFISKKGPQDFVTAADKAVEALISERIAKHYPDDGFLGEETGCAKQPLAFG